MKVIYYYDNDYKSNGENDIILPDENGQYNIPTNATDIAPEPGLYQPLHFNIDKQKWEGVSKEEWEKEHPNEEGNLIEPPNLNLSGTDEELRVMFANMQVQLVQANTMVMQLSQQNANLSQEVVSIKQKLDGGSE
ncbi:hypothetical protein [Staphylococcus sp. GDY8P72P]|uniref:hypothetical protein n=1 Tax=Staphylococcus sp. GDY8P72P TaxID=2804425 RepID=UPI0019518EB3|nr:hypothetical protein [Staphylococcus sp. GDY8P72P]